MVTQHQVQVKAKLEAAHIYTCRGGSGALWQIIHKKFSRKETMIALENLRRAVQTLENLLAITRPPV